MGKKSPQGFTTQSEYQKWYYQANKKRITERNKKYREENKEKEAERARTWHQANYKPKQRDPNTFTYKYVYQIIGDNVTEFWGVEKAAEQLFVCALTIRNSVRLRKGYCRALDCYFVISKEKLSRDEVLRRIFDRS